ncbi:hypothetical protein AWU01_05970 [Streptococcus pyogenes]|nr:hypothetical protein SPYAA216_0371 [Streptococcus pyogenes AA216]OAC59129.1 hypothetical protein AWU03_06390 [Streptococcus pyogenes]OAC62270.1 hypothetical protein AWU05_07840 [Streptococcus pyogenes]OAC62875.1 hypothetical protein AWU06_07870 [Streptococcus pyogenes]OAC73186.1 hypothetical protein AWU01_05970 [Streptococcus pyogenes]
MTASTPITKKGLHVLFFDVLMLKKASHSSRLTGFEAKKRQARADACLSLMVERTDPMHVVGDTRAF